MKCKPPPTLDEAKMGLTTLSAGYALCWALGELTRQGKQAIARKYMRKMWKIFRHGRDADEEGGDRFSAFADNSMALVLDEFFNRDGDMAKAAEELANDIRKVCPAPVWPSYYAGLVAARETALRRCLEGKGAK